MLRGYGRRADSSGVPAVVTLEEKAGQVCCSAGSETLCVDSPQELEESLARQ